MSGPNRRLPSIGLLAIVLVVIIWAGSFVAYRLDSSRSTPRTDLDTVVEQTRTALKRGDADSFRRLCTADGWKRINRTYDFHLGAIGFKGTFSDFLKESGSWMNEDSPDDVVRTDIDTTKVVLFFTRHSPIGVTIAYSKRDGVWHVHDMHPNEIDPKTMFEPE